MQWIHSSFLLFLIFYSSSWGKSSEFSWSTTAGKYTDLFKGKKKIARYVHERMVPTDRERTYKPFHHVYDEKGENFLTKGPGGKYSHHRGIYFGFSKCSALDGAGNKVSVDTWHCKRGYQTHEKFISQVVDDQHASHTVEIAWRVDDGTIFATEARTLVFRFDPKQRLQIDFQSILTSEQGEITLDGDPQHAGFQFRASNEVYEKSAAQTFYVRPGEGKDKKGATKNWPKDQTMTNLLWKGQGTVVGGKKYFTLYLDHPSNPKPSFYSERDYGRFGSYFKTKIKPNSPLRVQYRLDIGAGELLAEECEKRSQIFLDTKDWK